MEMVEANVYYARPTLPDAARVLACLCEKQIKFNHVEINKSQPLEFLKLQAKASTRVHGPTFDDGKEKLFESRAICRYLVENYAERGNNTLLGRESLERVSIERWLKTEEHSFDPPSLTLVFYLALAPDMGIQQDHDEMAESARKLSEVLAVYDQRLAESTFLAGNEFTLADLCHLPNSYYLKNQDLFTSKKHVSRWLEEMSCRDSWKEVTKILNMKPAEKVPSLAPPADSRDGSSLPAQSRSVQSSVKASPSEIPVERVSSIAPQPDSGHEPSLTGSTPKEGINGEKSGDESGKDASKSTSQSADTASTQTGSNDTPAKQGSSKQTAQHTAMGTGQTVSTDEGTTKSQTSEQKAGKGTNGEKSGTQSRLDPSSGQVTNGNKSGQQSTKDLSQNSTKGASTLSESNATPTKQGVSEQTTNQSTTGTDQFSSTNAGNGKSEASGTSTGKGFTSSGQGTDGEKSTEDLSQKSTKAADNESTHLPSNATNAKQGSYEQTTNQLTMGTDQSSSTNAQTGKSVASETSNGKGSSGQGTHGKKAGEKSTEDLSQNSTKGANNESTQSGSNATTAKQGSAEQTDIQATTGTDQSSSTNAGTGKSVASETFTGKGSSSSSSGQGTNGEKSRKDLSQNSTRGANNESTHSDSNAASAKQGSSEQTNNQSTTGTDQSSSTNAGTGKSMASETSTGKGSSSSGQGTNGKKTGENSTKDLSQNSTKGANNESTRSESNADAAKQGSSAQTNNQATTGTDQSSSTNAGTDKSTSGKVKETSLWAMKALNYEATQLRSNVNPTMQATSKGRGKKGKEISSASNGVGHLDHTMAISTQQVTSQPTPEKASLSQVLQAYSI